MTTATTHRHTSTARSKKFRDNMLKHGFKRIQRWVLSIENVSIQEQIKKDLANYCYTKDMKEWDKFALEQLNNIDGWI